MVSHFWSGWQAVHMWPVSVTAHLCRAIHWVRRCVSAVSKAEGLKTKGEKVDCFCPRRSPLLVCFMSLS